MEPRGSAGVGAVVVTYRPDLERLREALAATVAQARAAVVVDNGSPQIRELRALLEGFPSVQLISLGDNRGIAAALNIGVERLFSTGDLGWVLTLDQDTVIAPGAVESLLGAYGRLGDDLARSCGILAMSRELPRAPGWRRRWVEQSMVFADLGELRDRRCVITSGNLVFKEVFGTVRFDEKLFIDQVDTLFCADVRRAGWSVLELKEPTMDHRLGTTVEIGGRPRVLESPQRLYYIARNASYLVLRHDLPLRVFARDIIGLSRVRLAVEGPGELARCARILGTGVLDALLGRFGRREYRFLHRGSL